jgi:hypothetical protein
MDTIFVQEATKAAMRKPKHSAHTISRQSISFDKDKLKITNDVVALFKDNSAEFAEMYTEDYVKEKVATLIQKRLIYQYENDVKFPNDIGTPSNIISAKADALVMSYSRQALNIACVLKSQYSDENWLVLFPIYLAGTKSNFSDAIYTKIETKFFDIDKFPLNQIPNKKLATETAAEMTKKQFEDTVKTQRVSRTMSKL